MSDNPHTFSEALEKHRQLMKYFGATVTVEDHQRGAALEALHALECEQPAVARDLLGACIVEHGPKGALPEALMRAYNWIEPLGNPAQAIVELKKALSL